MAKSYNTIRTGSISKGEQIGFLLDEKLLGVQMIATHKLVKDRTNLEIQREEQLSRRLFEQFGMVPTFGARKSCDPQKGAYLDVVNNFLALLYPHDLKARKALQDEIAEYFTRVTNKEGEDFAHNYKLFTQATEDWQTRRDNAYVNYIAFMHEMKQMTDTIQDGYNGTSNAHAAIRRDAAKFMALIQELGDAFEVTGGLSPEGMVRAQAAKAAPATFFPALIERSRQPLPQAPADKPAAPTAKAPPPPPEPQAPAIDTKPMKAAHQEIWSNAKQDEPLIAQWANLLSQPAGELQQQIKDGVAATAAAMKALSKSQPADTEPVLTFHNQLREWAADLPTGELKAYQQKLSRFTRLVLEGAGIELPKSAPTNGVLTAPPMVAILPAPPAAHTARPAKPVREAIDVEQWRGPLTALQKKQDAMGTWLLTLLNMDMLIMNDAPRNIRPDTSTMRQIKTDMGSLQNTLTALATANASIDAAPVNQLATRMQKIEAIVDHLYTHKGRLPPFMQTKFDQMADHFANLLAIVTEVQETCKSLESSRQCR